MLKRIVVYSHSFWPAIGGVESYARAIAEGISLDAEFVVTVLTQTASTRHAPQWRFRILRRPGFFRLWSMLRAADVVFVAGPAIVPMLVSWALGRPFVVEHHGYQAVCPNGLLLNKYRGGVCGEAFRHKQYGECVRCGQLDSGMARGAIRTALTFFRTWLCRRAGANVAVSEHVRKRHPSIPMRVIYHGIADQLCSIPMEAGAGGTDTVRFGYVGRLVEEKGLSLLIAATAKVKAGGHRVCLVFVGDGPLRSVLCDQAAQLGLSDEVRFTGFLTGAELERATSSIDVVVMPSICEETAGLAAMEQMMRGRAVVASDIGGLGEVVGEGAVRFRPFDEDDLAAALISLMDVEVRRNIGRAGRERAVRMFQLQRMVDEHKQLFAAVAGGNG